MVDSVRHAGTAAKDRVELSGESVSSAVDLSGSKALGHPHNLEQLAKANANVVGDSAATGLQNANDSSVEAGRGLLSSVQQRFSHASEAATSGVQQAGDSAAQASHGLLTSIKDKVTHAGDAAANSVHQASDAAVQSSRGALSSLKGQFSSAGDAAADQMQHANDSAVHAGRDAVSSVQNSVSSTGQATADQLQHAQDAAVHSGRGVLSSIKDKFTGASDAVSHKAHEVQSSAAHAANDVSSSVNHGTENVSHAASSLWSKVRGAGSSARDHVEAAGDKAASATDMSGSSLLGHPHNLEQVAKAKVNAASDVVSSSNGVSSTGAAGEHATEAASTVWGKVRGAGDAAKEQFSHMRSDISSESHHLSESVQSQLAHAKEVASNTWAHDTSAISKASEMASSELHAHGLGGWTPSGMLQHLLDSAHNLTGLPWWATIIFVTCGIRLAIAPLLVYVQANSIRLANVQPHMQGLLREIEYAKKMGNQQEMQAAAGKVRKLLKDNNASPFRSFLLPAVQMPIFLSFYFALSGLANAPLPSMMKEGALWFPDLTVADPYYVLPVVSSLMTLAVLETGAETGTTGMNQTPQARLIKNVLRGVTVLATWFIANFPAALLVYWATTNTFSLVQLLALRTRFMKRMLRLPEKIDHPVQPHIKQKSFMEGVREGMGNQQQARPRPPSALWRKPEDAPAGMEGSRGRALDSMLSDKSGAPKATNTVDTNHTHQAEKDARVAAARERRLRQRD